MLSQQAMGEEKPALQAAQTWRGEVCFLVLFLFSWGSLLTVFCLTIFPKVSKTLTLPPGGLQSHYLSPTLLNLDLPKYLPEEASSLPSGSLPSKQQHRPLC